MKKTGWFSSVFAAAVLSLAATGANAQATRTWVSGVGDDANPCSRTAPCKTFAGSISKTAPGGEINCLDPGGFGAVTITKGISIICDPYANGHLLVSGTNAIVVNAGPNDIVMLSGLDIQGIGTGLVGVNFLNGGRLIVQNSLIKGFNGGAATGIAFTPNTANNTTTPSLLLEHVTITDNGINGSSVGAGVLIAPTGGLGANASLTNVQLSNSFIGLKADGTTGTGAVSVSVKDTVSSSNGAHGFVAISAGTTVNLSLSSSVAVDNVQVGVKSSGAGATARLTNTTVTGNATGIQALAGAGLLGAGNNMIDGNPSNANNNNGVKTGTPGIQ